MKDSSIGTARAADGGRRPLVLAIAAALVLGTGVPGATLAADSIWTGAASTDWHDAANWSAPPASTGSVLIDSQAPNPSRLASGEVGVDYLTVGGSARGSLRIDGGSMLHVTGGHVGDGPWQPVKGLVIGDAVGSTGDVTVSGAGSVLTVEHHTHVGYDGTGTLSVLDGATANLGLDVFGTETMVGFGYYSWGADGDRTGSGSVEVDGAGSTLNYAGGLNVANGSLSVTNGARLDGTTNPPGYWLDALGMGLPAGGEFAGTDGNATATVSGTGSAWITNSSLTVAAGGHGHLSVLQGGTATFLGLVTVGGSGALYDVNGNDTGLRRAGTGSILVSGAGSMLAVTSFNANSGALDVGGAGDGSMKVEDAAAVSVAGVLTVGAERTGSLEIASGGRVTVAGSDANGIGAMLGRGAGARGELTVGGEGSTLTVDAGVQVGHAGTGSLSVLDGGTANLALSAAYSEVVVGLGYYGFPEGVENGTGAITVDGNGSTIHYAGGLNLLDGSLAVTGGGRLLSQVREADGDTFWLDVVGFGTPVQPDWNHAELGGSAEVTVRGAGSQWTSVNGVTLGQGGTATLSILDGGQASFMGRVDLGRVGYLTDQDGQIVGTKPGSGSALVSGAGSSLSVLARDGLDKGVIRVGAEGDGMLQVSDGAAISAVDSIRIGARGTVTVGSGADDRLAGGVDAPRVLVDGMLAFSHGSSSYGFTPDIEGSGAIEARSGFTRLSGDGSAFAGETRVGDGATLSVDGSLGGNVTVALHGRLEGTGTIADADVGGTLAPGNSPGTLYVSGDLLMRDTSVYEAQIDTVTSASDSVVVAGNVTIQPGSTLKIENIGGGTLKPGDSLQLIQATGTVDGQFALVDDPVSPFLGFGLNYGDGGITVGVTRSALSFASVGTTPMEKAVGGALDSLPGDSALAGVLYGELDSTAKAAAAIRQMPGVLAADVQRVMLDDSRLPRDAVLGRLQRSADAAEAGAFWVQGMGYWGSTDAADGVPKARSNSSGMVLGTDAGLGGSTRLGVAAGFGQTSYRMAGQHASAHVTGSHLALYGRSGMGAFGLSYGAAHSWNEVGSNRSFDIGTARQQLNGEHDARTGQVFADLGYRLGGDPARYLEPFVAAAYVAVDADGWKETGTEAALATRSASDSAVFGTLGLRWSAATASARLFGTVGWRHVFGFDRAAAQQSFVAGGDAFEVRGLPIARDAAVVDVGMDFAIARHARVAAAYSGLIAGDSRDQGGRIQLTFDF